MPHDHGIVDGTTRAHATGEAHRAHVNTWESSAYVHVYALLRSTPEDELSDVAVTPYAHLLPILQSTTFDHRPQGRAALALPRSPSPLPSSDALYVSLRSVVRLIGIISAAPSVLSVRPSRLRETLHPSLVEAFRPTYCDTARTVGVSRPRVLGSWATRCWEALTASLRCLARTMCMDFLESSRCTRPLR